ncbi:MAG: FAD:protein FMN transferase [Bacteroidales bacterium]
MGTRCDLLIPGKSQDVGDHISLLIQREVDRLENLLSRYRKGAEINRLNETASLKPVPVSAELFILLQKCVRWNEMTNGYFDISLGTLHEAWKNNPAMDAFLTGALIEKKENQKILLNTSDNSVFFSSQEISLDMGAVGKGIALENIRRILQRESILNALVNFGNSSVLAHGNHPYGETWAVGIQHMENPGQMEHVFYLKDQSLSTSGISSKNSLSRDKILGHIINPHTGLPLTTCATMSVVSSDPVEAEVLSTALLCAPDFEREQILKNFKPAQFREILYR